MASLLFDVIGRLYPKDQEFIKKKFLPTDTPQSVASKTKVSQHARTSTACYCCLKMLRLTFAKKRCEWQCNKTTYSETFCVFPLVKETKSVTMKIFPKKIFSF